LLFPFEPAAFFCGFALGAEALEEDALAAEAVDFPPIPSRVKREADF